MKKESYAKCQYDRLGIYSFAVVHGERKNTSIMRNVPNLTTVEVRCHLPLEPISVGNEILDGKRVGYFASNCFLVTCDGKVLLRSGNIRGFTFRTEEHPSRHILFPERHRLPNDIRLDSCGFEMSCRTQSIRTGSDDHDFFGLYSPSHRRGRGGQDD